MCFLLFYPGIFLCLLALSIPTDAAKKKLLKKLAKELGYKLENAIFKNIGDTVNDNKNDLDNVSTFYVGNFVINQTFDWIFFTFLGTNQC